ncbi:hypothetical protein ABG79_00073 [Caloramator mitchellensis]|uniref:DUF445 domain-containing protein n=1 Tax=Caloramator mitchellensis TaxID=908809 RepID=A0A0R3K3C0_CALMK|nr:DUF445 family protein [Caloramator mitchellensis]KRQ87908.1 hypothetical protein ABG79_00073 [Caloramator mitchellensis]
MKILLSIIIGATIGYITNYIAIKMLFRPFREIKIWGIKLPFTPGLIPKERGRIAKSVGETIGTHLLSSEIIADVLRSDRINEEIKKWFKGKYIEIKTSNIKLDDFARKYLNEQYDEVKIKIKNQFKRRINSLLNDGNFLDTLKFILRGQLEKLDIEKLFNYLFSNEKFIDLIYSLIDNTIFRISASKKKIKDIIPERTLDYLKESVINNKDDIANYIQSSLKRPYIRNKVVMFLNDIIQQNFGKFISMFISPDFVAQKVIASIEDYLEKKENKMDLAIIINNFIDNIAETDVSSLMNLIWDKNEFVREVSEKLLFELERESNLLTLERLTKKYFNDENSINCIFEKFDEFKKSDSFGILIDSIVDKSLNIFLNANLDKILEDINPEELETFFDTIKRGLEELLKNNIEYFIELLNISKIVEDRINSFDVEFAEKIILEVASKELKAITWLGALLGGLIGLLNPLIELIL